MNSQQILDLVQVNRENKHFGRLLYKRDRDNKKVLHYSVQLNDKQSLAWEPCNSGAMKGKGQVDTWNKVIFSNDAPPGHLPARVWDAWNDGGVGSFSAFASKLVTFDL